MEATVTKKKKKKINLSPCFLYHLPQSIANYSILLLKQDYPDQMRQNGKHG